MGAWIYGHPVVFVGLLWLGASVVVVGLLGLILHAAQWAETQADEDSWSPERARLVALGEATNRSGGGGSHTRAIASRATAPSADRR